MSNLDITVSADIPADATVGDEYTITATVRITGIREDLIDVSTSFGPKEYMPGERRYEAHIANAKLTPLKLDD